MSRIILVDDSPTVRETLARRLRSEGHDVELATDGVTGAQLALAHPPHLVVTDLWMPGMSGVQLCRLLRSEQATSHVPIILVTADADRKARFWARSAGAAAYVGKADPDELVHRIKEVLKKTTTFPPVAPTDHASGSIQERLSRRLDDALFESVVAGEVRALAQREGDAEKVFTGLATLVSEISAYRWMALLTAYDGRLLLHSHPVTREACEAEARATLAIRPEADTFALVDERAVIDGRAAAGRPAAPIVADVSFGLHSVGTIALGPAGAAASREDERVVAMVARELGGPLRLVALLEQTRTAAMTDPLTGLMNRRAFIEAMGRELSRAKRFGQPLALLMLDIDHFKAINDTRGHAGGDAVLKGLGALLRNLARKSDLVGRWGGEEFVVALVQTPEDGAKVAAERLRAAIAAASHPAPGGDAISATASVGLAVHLPEEPLDQLVGRADHAMYAAKQGGRNRVEHAAKEPLGARRTLADLV